MDPETAFTNWMTTLAVAIEVGTEANDATMEAEATDAALANVKSQIHHLSTFGTFSVTGGRMFFDQTNADGEYRAAYNVELSSTDGTSIKYEEGDHVSLLPPTDPEHVKAVHDFIEQWGDVVSICRPWSISVLTQAFRTSRVSPSGRSFLTSSSTPRRSRTRPLKNISRTEMSQSPRRISRKSFTLFHSRDPGTSPSPLLLSTAQPLCNSLLLVSRMVLSLFL
jgi:hypothetical protein